MLEYHSDNSVSVINSSRPSIVSDREITGMQKDLRAAVHVDKDKISAFLRRYFYQKIFIESCNEGDKRGERGG